jgi:hypothetical protein
MDGVHLQDRATLNKVYVDGQMQLLEMTLIGRETYKFNFPIPAPYMWYQNLKQPTEVGLMISLISHALCPIFLPVPDVSIYIPGQVINRTFGDMDR